MTNTNIEWTDATWNPVRGCTVVSEGCRNCYAMKQAHRFSGPGQPYEGLTEIGNHGPRWNGNIRLVPEVLDAPTRWKKPRRIFVNSMSDLFHEDVPTRFIARVFEVMAACPQHTFQILTKRPERIDSVLYGEEGAFYLGGGDYLPSVWIGVSVENQQTADERIPLLLSIPAAVRWVSAEPLLGPTDLTNLTVRTATGIEQWDALDRVEAADAEPGSPNTVLDWVVLGGESGPQARSCNVHWIRSLLRQCRTANVSCFVKQLGSCVVDRNDAGFKGDTDGSWPMDTRFEQEWSEQHYQGTLGQVRLRDRKGGDPSEWPEDLRVREYPSTTKGVAS